MQDPASHQIAETLLHRTAGLDTGSVATEWAVRALSAFTPIVTAEGTSQKSGKALRQTIAPESVTGLPRGNVQ